MRAPTPATESAAAGPSCYRGQLHTLCDAYQPQPALCSLIPKLLPLRSLSIWYGSPGHLKTNLLLDLTMAVATGSRWLPSKSGSDAGRPVNQAAVLWVDVDNGQDVMAERLAAFGRAYGAAEDTPISWITFPDPPVQAKDGLGEIARLANEREAKLIIFDNLLRISGVKDENSSEMDMAMKHCRKLAEDTGAAVCLIHHRRKDTTGSVADSLRGHSSILASVDAAFVLEKHELAVTVTNTKARRLPVEPFTAEWICEVMPENAEILKKARFFRVPLRTGRTRSDEEVRERILQALEEGEITFGALEAKVPLRADHVRVVRNQLAKEELVTIRKGRGNSMLVKLAEPLA
jgi:hypothetical protein